MSSKQFAEANKICSECGRKIEFGCCYSPTTNWTYKTSRPTNEREDTDSNLMYQCSYTCYDHAKLRNQTEQRWLTVENFKSYVKRNEDMMKSQDKNILHPIDVTKKRKGIGSLYAN